MKPKTHVFLAEIALQDALQDGKITMYTTDYVSGAVGSPIGEFDVDPQILLALRSNPAQFRAGVLGPDAYPDIATGQEVIHPAGKDTPGQQKGVDINAGGAGTDPWLKYLYSRAFNGCNPDGSARNLADKTTANQAFVLGYFAHAAADIYAHTFINYYAGGPFHFEPIQENAIKHMVMEGYIEKRTPHLASYDASIANGVDQFIYRNMIDGQRNTYLGQRLLIGSGAEYSLPAVFSTIRADLVKDIQAYYDRKAKYDRDYDEASGLTAAGILIEKGYYVTANAARITYYEAWRDDIDEGLAALPQMSDELAKALFFNPTGMDQAKAQQIAHDYVTSHLLSMAGYPDGIGSTIEFVNYIFDLIPSLKQMIDDMERDLLNYLMKSAFGMTIEDIKKYATNPAMIFNQVLNGSAFNTEGNGHLIDLQTFNAQHLHISDPGNTNPNESFDYTKFPAAYNGVVMIKLELMSQSEINRLSLMLAQQYDPISIPPTLSEPNVMLGFIETLDGSNQWNANPLPNQMVFAKNPKLYQKIFMQQSGETELSPVPTPEAHKITLIAAAASSQLEQEYNGKPQTTDRLLENGEHFWNSDDTGKDPTPWFWVELGQASVVTEFTIRWKSSFGINGARAMKYRVYASMDGNNWFDTGRSEADVADLSASLDQDKLLGWPGLTKFIKVSMSNSSYADANNLHPYFTCYGVEVWGVSV